MAESIKIEELKIGDVVIDTQFSKGLGVVVRHDDASITVKFEAYPDFLVEYPLDVCADYLSKVMQ